MTSANPPYPYFNGITYNSQYFVSSSGSGLTQTQANALYLRKTTADTATALETFTGGIASNSIQSTTATTDMSVGSSQTDGILNLGTGTRTSTGIINIGTGTGASNAINIGTGAGLITGSTSTKAVSIGGIDTSSSREYDVYLSKIKFKTYNGGSEWNYYDQTMSDPFIFFGRQTSGVLNIAGGNGVPRSGAVSIATNGSNTCNVNIANAAGTAIAPTTGQVNIANGSNGIATSYTVSTNIGAGSTTGAVTIGNTSNTTTITSATINLANQASSATTINMLNGATTTGAVNIANGTGATQATPISIGSGNNTGAILIGNGANGCNINSGTVQIANNLAVGDITIKNAAGSVGTVTIAGATTGTNTTAVNISTGTTSGAIAIGSSSNTTTVNSVTVHLKSGVGTLALPLAGTVNIATGTGATFVSTAVNIATGDTTGTVTLGNSANIVQVNGGLSIGTGKGITLSPAASYVLPTTGQLGFISTGTGTTTTLSGITLLKTIDLTPGTYILNGNVRFAAPGANGEISIGTSSTAFNQSNYAFSTGIVGLCLQVSAFVGITVDTPYYLLGRAASNGAVNNVNLNIIRIA